MKNIFRIKIMNLRYEILAEFDKDMDFKKEYVTPIISDDLGNTREVELIKVRIIEDTPIFVTPTGEEVHPNDIEDVWVLADIVDNELPAPEQV